MPNRQTHINIKSSWISKGHSQSVVIFQCGQCEACQHSHIHIRSHVQIQLSELQYSVVAELWAGEDVLVIYTLSKTTFIFNIGQFTTPKQCVPKLQ